MYLSSLKISIFKFNNDDIMPVPMSFVSKLLPGFCLVLLLALLAFPVDSKLSEKKVIKYNRHKNLKSILKDFFENLTLLLCYKRVSVKFQTNFAFLINALHLKIRTFAVNK